MLASTPHVTLRPPDIGVEHDLWFYGRKRHAVFRVMGGGHTDEDAVLFLPEDRTIFCGDLLFANAHSFLGFGNPEVMLTILADLEASATAEILIPGHGSVSGRGAIGEMRHYIEAVQNRAEELVKCGATDVEVARDPIPEAFREWLYAYPFYTANLQFMFKRAEARGEETVWTWSSEPQEI